MLAPEGARSSRWVGTESEAEVEAVAEAGVGETTMTTGEGKEVAGSVTSTATAGLVCK